MCACLITSVSVCLILFVQNAPSVRWFLISSASSPSSFLSSHTSALGVGGDGGSGGTDGGGGGRGDEMVLPRRFMLVGLQLAFSGQVQSLVGGS